VRCAHFFDQIEWPWTKLDVQAGVVQTAVAPTAVGGNVHRNSWEYYENDCGGQGFQTLMHYMLLSVYEGRQSKDNESNERSRRLWGVNEDSMNQM
jgi:hypothetical protein